MVQTVRQTTGIHQLLHTVIDVDVYRSWKFSCRGAEADSHGLAVQQTIETLQLRVDKVVDAPNLQVVHVVVLLSGRRG